VRRLEVMCAIVCFAAATVGAQTKVTGTAEFGKADPQQMIPAGDRPDHRLGVAQRKCTWTKPQNIGGDRTKQGVSTETDNVNGACIHARGTHVIIMESGDKYFRVVSGDRNHEGCRSANRQGHHRERHVQLLHVRRERSCEVPGECQLAK
jgi:hypothetical protein